MTMACTICHRPAGISDDDDEGCPPVDLGRCAASGGFECRAVAQATSLLRVDRDAWTSEHENALMCWESDVSALARIIDDAKSALGPAWLHGGASLADGIRRKTAALERLGMDPTIVRGEP